MSTKGMRLRIFDLNTPLFWLTAFYEPTGFGKPWLSISLWNPHTWKRWWVHVWQWESVPDERGAYAIATKKDAHANS